MRPPLEREDMMKTARRVRKSASKYKFSRTEAQKELENARKFLNPTFWQLKRARKVKK